MYLQCLHRAMEFSCNVDGGRSEDNDNREDEEIVAIPR